jgi:hypothetical protein
MFMSL